MRHKVVSPPTSEPVTLEEVKEYLRVTHDHEDDVIDGQIRASRRLCENAARMAFIEQTRETVYRLPYYVPDNSFFTTSRVVDPDHINQGVSLIAPPIKEITSISAYKQIDALTTVPSTAYRFNADSRLIEWIPEFFIPLLPVNEFLKVVYKCGLPVDEFKVQFPDILEAIKITTAVLYDERGYSKQGLPPAAWQLLSPYWTSPTFHR